MSQIPWDYRLKLIATTSAVAIITVFNFAPFPQDPDYHRFADQRTILGIANFFNVVSNLPMVWLGNLGMRLVSLRHPRGGLESLMPIYFIFFAGVFLTGFGSAYYHLHPDNPSLFWDRLPMTIAFMGFFSAIVGECLAERWALKGVIPLLAIGVGSVVYWHVTELGGRGDLRPYALVQFLPMLLVPMMLWLYRPKVLASGWTWGLLATYGVAKLSEFFDAELYRCLAGISGHTLKHLVMAVGVYMIYRALQQPSTDNDRDAVA